MSSNKEISLHLDLDDGSWVELDNYGGPDDEPIFLEADQGDGHNVCLVLTPAQAKALYNALYIAIYGVSEPWVPPHEKDKTND